MLFLFKEVKINLSLLVLLQNVLFVTKLTHDSKQYATDLKFHREVSPKKYITGKGKISF